MPGTIRNLTERRVPQVLAIYLGAAFGVVQFVDFISSRYLLPSAWTDMALLAMALLLPSVMLYTYNHGRPGPDEWQRSEKIFIPLNLLVLLVLLALIGSGRPLSATGRRITITDEKGNTREEVVPNKAYRKRVAMFMFDAPTDTASKWLQFGVPHMAWHDLLQQRFMDVLPPAYLREGLTKKGYAAGTEVPLSLKRDVVSELHVPHFVTGRVEKVGNEYVATVQVYATASGKVVNERTYRATDAMQLADQVSAGLVEALEIPNLSDAPADMPVSEILTRNPAALRAYVDASAALQVESNFARAASSVAEAVKLDPTFAAAHLLQYAIANLSNQPALATSAVQKAMDHSYRMPERQQELIKADYYIIKQDYQRAFALLDMLAQLYPDDIQVHTLLMNINTARDDKDAIIASASKILELDPTRSEVMLTLAQMHEDKGDAKAALEVYEEYAAKYPKEPRAHRSVGNLHRRVGAHAKARAAYEKALLVGPDDVEAMVELATLDWYLGDFAGAQQKTGQALAAARTPEDRVRALNGVMNLHDYRGDIRQAIKYAEEALLESTKFQPAGLVMFGRMQVAGEWARVDKARAERDLAAMHEQVKPPFDMYLPLVDLRVYIETKDAVKAEQAVNELDALMKRANFKWLARHIASGRGRVAELRGKCADAIRFFEETRKASPLDVSSSNHIGRCLRKLGKYGDAEKELNKVLAVMPSHGSANMELGLLHQQKGDVVKARQYLQRATQTFAIADPNLEPARQAREALAALQ